MRNLFFRILLSPFALLYGIGVGFRNLLYKKGILRSISFDIPVIVVGNLSAGGTGKSPHVEFIIRYLQNYLPVGVLSRGYKRRTEGLKFVQRSHAVEDVGDEPLQIKIKHPHVTVAVAERRTLAIPSMLSKHPNLKCIVLDDAFQHRALKPGLSILLTTFDQPFFSDFLLPSGNLREWRDGYHRADIMIVTKCPENLSETTRNEIRSKINPKVNQKLFFSNYQYGKAYYLLNSKYRLQWTPGLHVVLICAIANTDYLESYLLEKVAKMHTMAFPDHHYFTSDEIDQLIQRYKSMPGERKAVITTEKDAVRLIRFREKFIEANLPIFVLPIQVNILFEQEEEFKEYLRRFLLNFTV